MTEQRDEIRKTPLAFHLRLDQFYQQVCNHHDPDLRLDRVGAFAVKEVQGKILLQLLVERSDLPSVPVNLDDFGVFQFNVKQNFTGQNSEKKRVYITEGL